MADYQKAHFHWALYSCVALFLAAFIALNFSIDFYNSYIINGNGPWTRFWFVFLFNLFPFLATALMVSYFKGDWKWAWIPRFWLLLTAAFLVSALSQVWKPLDFISAGLEGNQFRYVSSVARKADSLFNVVLPIVLVCFIFEKQDRRSLYGLRSSHWEWRPYAYMFAAMVVLIGLASFFQDLQAYYPRYLRTRGPEFGQTHGIDQIWLVLVYELAYGSDFVSVELFYRGLLVVAFYRYFGSSSVLIMVPAYVFLHFGKPITEAMSSAIGGYILGIISLQSRNVWGGVILHVGVAWLMEFFGWLQIFYR